MRILGIIPARLAATRFPNKPLAKIQGIPMIGHCYLRSKVCTLLDELYVATCDKEIVEYIECIGGKVILTSNKHERASERCVEALKNIEDNKGKEIFDIIVMIQGDEPLIDPKMINEAVRPLLLDQQVIVSNLMSPLNTREDRLNPNNVKVITDINGNALYMSREPLPSDKKFKGGFKSFRQLGLIAFTRDALLKFILLKTTPLEVIESVDMNRFLEHRIPIRMVVTKYQADAVDVPHDLERVNQKMETDHLFTTYSDKIL